MQGFTISEAACTLHVSRPTLYKLIREYHIKQNKFTDISDQDLDAAIIAVKQRHPHVGEVMLNGHLRAQNIIVQRRRLRDAVKRVDVAGVESRRVSTIQRRVYFVPFPNYIWHVDGNHKLIRWKLVVHSGMDGYSRLLTFIECSNNNQAETVLNLFNKAVVELGRPLHIRTDYGTENVLIWEDMRQHRGLNSVMTGSSVHNQRIERFHRDLNRNCRDVFAPIFYELESANTLNCDNDSDLFCLHYVFIPRINRTLNEFKAAFNNHSISSEGNRTPNQLFRGPTHVASPMNTVSPTVQRLETSSAQVHYRFCPLNSQALAELLVAVNPLEEDNNNGKTLYHTVQEFVFKGIPD